MQRGKNVLGLKIVGHDPGAALISGNRVVAISEERLNRIKYSTGLFPKLSTPYCLQALGLKPEDIDLIVMDYVGELDEKEVLAIFTKENTLDFSRAEIKVINHHLAHAASAYYCSPFTEGAVMIVDGTGSRVESKEGSFVETETLYRAAGTTLEQIQKTVHRFYHADYPDTYGIGKLYTFITRRLLEFGMYNEGKTMGLASYGNAQNIFKLIPKDRFMKEVGGHFLCNPKITYPGSGSFSLKRFLRDPRKVIINYAVMLLKLVKKTGSRLKNKPVFSPIHIPIPPRPRDLPLPEQKYNDLAAVVQDIIEDVFLGLSRRAHAATGSRNICIAGGCGLNGVSNNKILHDKKFAEIFIQPASSDTGIPLGCALWGQVHLGEPRTYVMRDAYLGREYSGQEIQEAMQKTNGISFKKSSAVAEETAKLLAEQKVVGWFQFGSEYGPRSLGARSILADPRRAEMKNILNDRVKHRELWRPFAASVLKEKANEYFELDYEESPFMLLVPKIRERAKKDMQALVHVDGTCRIQTVTKEDNGLYYDLIQAFHKETGVPLIVNTSFNLAGEPIIESPEDALRCFLSTDMDYLVLGSYVVKKD
ncbi:MAG TPA: carbamoyltransferase C-terminal domain-containing protein [Candidatus Paceibacterota bacterium]